MVWTLAGGRIDAEAEESITWYIPLPRVLQYYHCALRANMAWTVPTGQPVRKVAERLRERVRLELPPDLDDTDE
ncbi:hypothetical protein [Verrucomicrobium spinosum]|uniref:hypothetical protein n=1 Tax=Verrucomicrobium spinosum TaxID=2736 RepID=UPI0001746668|nr:hypothetical protein [Verrucomicrobium spinosum]